VTETDESVAVPTVSVALPWMPETVAVMATVPPDTVVTVPVDAIVATVGLLEAHVTPVARGSFVPSEKMPVAVKVKVVLSAGIFFVTGVTDTEVSLAVDTVTAAVPDTSEPVALLEAVMVVVPAAIARTTPALETVATAGLLDVQLAVLVRFFVVALSYMPVAVSVWVVFAGSVVEGGVTAIDVSVTRTFTVALPVIVPLAALMVAVPGATVITTPAALTVAMFALLELHVAVLVRFCVVPSVYVPIAVRACVTFAYREEGVGVIAIDLSFTVARSGVDIARGCSSLEESLVGAAQPPTRATSTRVRPTMTARGRRRATRFQTPAYNQLAIAIMVPVFPVRTRVASAAGIPRRPPLFSRENSISHPGNYGTRAPTGR